MGGDLKIASKVLAEEGHALVVVRDNRVLLASRMPGVKSLLEALDSNVLPGAAVADKVIGRAAAMIAVQGEVGSVYSPVMSQGAVEVLTEAGILHLADRIVPYIKNREGTGPCPIEMSTESTVVPEKGVAAIRKMLAELAGRGSSAPNMAQLH